MRIALRTKLCTLAADTFLDRFRRRLLARGFTKVRHYGLLANNARPRLIALARTAIAAATKRKPPRAVRDAAVPADEGATPPCPHCGQTNVHFVALVLPSGRRLQARPPMVAKVREPP